MASIVIITKQCYLLCEAINYIAVNEVHDDGDEADPFGTIIIHRKKSQIKTKKSTKRKPKVVKEKQFQIIIDFVPIAGASHSGAITKSRSSGDSVHVGFTVTGRERTLELFSHMVEQIREQIPDHMYLDRLVEKFLSETADEHSPAK